jgi:hypothetical protein
LTRLAPKRRTLSPTLVKSRPTKHRSSVAWTDRPGIVGNDLGSQHFAWRGRMLKDCHPSVAACATLVRSKKGPRDCTHPDVEYYVGCRLGGSGVYTEQCRTCDFRLVYEIAPGTLPAGSCWTARQVLALTALFRGALDPHYMIDDPSPFEPLEVWQEHLQDLMRLDQGAPEVPRAIAHALETIARIEERGAEEPEEFEEPEA